MKVVGCVLIEQSVTKIRLTRFTRRQAGDFVTNRYSESWGLFCENS